ncbi:hypothetical protein QWI17_07335 [Gilvimarinus sp. SDUM040013]|uniref:Uncharacterized protein n=1 Tax=Gilvimarinus gilvus TaxID=3058038 RepID=A0ABU4S2T3_9GAMM|nr:hypothetical protein [Gilvimarinus sp. SDUM040013]MDO3385646.1 hypothetical protein [Gilvimarinus sp. SDUM040013]MDX6851392.1 hypothetical protein [Gilvimarinus sp. SDUM040013]
MGPGALKETVKWQKAKIDELEAEIESLKSPSQPPADVTFIESLRSPNVSNSTPEDFLADNTTFNFRLNEALKSEFSELCRREHLSAGSALKRYMTECVRFGMIK